MRKARLGLLAALSLSLGGCATGTPLGGGHGRLRYTLATPSASPRGIPGSGAGASVALTRDPEARDRVLKAARTFIGQSRLEVDGHRYADACNGLVEAAYAAAEVELHPEAKPGDNAVTGLFRFSRIRGRVFERGTPAPGDLVFFRETYDQNRDGRRNDGLTHVGLVDAVEKDGTVVVIHRVRRGVVRYRMNLAQPTVRKDPKTGKVLNDYLRPAGRTAGQVLTGQLFVAYASLLPEQGETLARR